MASLKSMNRQELNAEATRLGIADAEQLEKNADVIAAIEANETYQAEQKAAEQARAEETAKAAQDATEASAEKKTTYIVNGVEVDPNGKPVKGA
jgi:hypothetical protein